MVRTRLIVLTAAFSLALTSGCSGLSNFSLFNRHRCTTGAECCPCPETGDCDGPVLGDACTGSCPGMLPPMNPGGMMAPGNMLTPIPTTPPPGAPIAPTPRLVPQPQTQAPPTATTTPYVPR